MRDRGRGKGTKDSSSHRESLDLNDNFLTNVDPEILENYSE